MEQEVDGDLGAIETSAEKALLKRLGEVDVVLAGPPCQGHSDLNNHTRREDPRNQLYARAARFIELTLPDAFIIENV
ncbi:DNA cytosine methyltransferase, partial [Enterococcus faecium]